MQEKIINKIKYERRNFPETSFKSFIIFLSISIYFQIFQPVSAFSQTDSLHRYLEIAAKNNPGVLQKLNEYQAALQKIPQVGSLPDPLLSAGVFLKPMELVSGNQVADLRLMQMFPWFGVLKYAKDEMSLMAKAKFELFRDAKLQVFYDVQRTWYELYKVQKDISISEKNIEILKLIERLALVRFKSASLQNPGTSSQSSATSSVSSSASTGASGMQTMGAGQSNTGSSGSSGILHAVRHHGSVLQEVLVWQIFTGYKLNQAILKTILHY